MMEYGSWHCGDSSPGRTVTTIILVAAAIVYSLAAYSRNAVWTSPLSLWSDNFSKTPDKIKVHFNLSQAYRDLNMHSEDMALWLEGIKKFPDDQRAHYNISLAYFNNGDIRRSFLHMKRVVEMNPNDTFAHNHLGNTYMTWGDLDKAAYHYKESIRHDKINRHALPHYNLGLIYLQKGLINKAAEEFRAALRIYPDLKEARDQLSEIEPFLPAGR